MFGRVAPTAPVARLNKPKKYKQDQMLFLAMQKQCSYRPPGLQIVQIDDASKLNV